MRENSVESYALRRCSDHRALALKTEHIYPGFPDRTVFGFPRVVGFMELKRIGEDPMPKQALCHTLLRSLGFVVHVPHCNDEVEEALKQIFGKRYRAP